MYGLGLKMFVWNHGVDYFPLIHGIDSILLPPYLVIWPPQGCVDCFFFLWLFFPLESRMSMTYMNMNFARVFSIFFSSWVLGNPWAYVFVWSFSVCLSVCLQVNPKKLSRDCERVRSCDGTGFVFFCFFLFSLSLSAPIYGLQKFEVFN